MFCSTLRNLCSCMGWSRW